MELFTTIPSLAGLGDAISQIDRIIANLEGKLAKVDKSLVVSEEEAEALGVFSPQEVEIVLEVAQHLGDNQVSGGPARHRPSSNSSRISMI